MIYYPDFESFSKAELTTVERCENFAIRADIENLFISLNASVSSLEHYEDLYAQFDVDVAQELHDKAVIIMNMIVNLKRVNHYFKSAIITHQLDLEAQEFNRFFDDQNA